MHWKKYTILLPPFILIALLMAIYLPSGQKHYVILAALVFWAFYYTWIFIEKKRGKE
ncbi:hypothetical protein [Falsibacillus pallidus]|uniref:Uncharacterized protein n=1 Tax=Falsibacillus pallidus TaxID=493781 RepID=A0A370G2R5_9BACI|nr:hypothetical protein [Falsibacillus pallidus]RDI38025.1 hypothetical protein DFR59_11937 [Falsibacillus pallidus]